MWCITVFTVQNVFVWTEQLIVMEIITQNAHLTYVVAIFTSTTC